MKNIYKLILLTVLCIGLLSACSEPPKPENTLEKYVGYWEKQDFKNMYKLLDTKSQEAMSEKDFVERYESIYSGIEVSKLDVKMKKQKKDDKENSESVNLPYTLKMETIGGPITFTQNMKLNLEKKKDTEEWGIQWNTSHIFPDMKKGDRVSASSISPKRGQILDSEGKALAVNGVAAEIIIVPEKLPQDKAKTLEPLSKILGMTTEEIQKQLDQPWVKQDQAVPIKKISVEDPKLKDTIALEGVDYQKKSTRLYPLKEAAAHLTGYIAPVSAEDMKKLQGKGYSAQDWIGKAGLEQVYEEQLRGKSGGIIKIMDSKGEEKSILAQNEVENGKDVKTTINSKVQLSIYNQIKADVGTSSAIHPKTGDVLALVNSPSYDPNQFTLGLTKELRQKWADDPKQPMLNRFKYVYAPGSTLKPLTAAIGLENGTLNPNAEMKVSGKTWQKDKEAWGNYKVTRVTDVPSVNLEKALIYSDNIYFAQAALNLGEDKFTEGLKKFGFGEEVPVSFPFTASSIGKGGMSEGQLADSGFGQGQIQMSALHVAMSYTPFLNEGNLLAPRLDQSKESTVWKESVISSDTAKMINDDLVQVVANKNGTAHNDAFMKDLPLAGKTGTAELKTSLDDKNGKELGWFVGYNTQDPSLLVSMMIEDVKKRNGSHYVTPKVKNVFKENVK